MPPPKSYCFTLNNYTEDELTAIERVASDESHYAIVGREVGESGTRHLQGYIRFKRPLRFQTIKDRLLPRCHIEIAAGSPDANRRYCSKDGEFREFGEFPNSSEGSRKSRDDVAKSFASAMESGRRGLAEFVEAYPGTWYFSGHNLLRNYLSIQRPIERPDICVRWFWGSPGKGKSRQAHLDLPDAYIKEPKTKWWNGYMLESDVIIDDYGQQCIDLNHLLRWFDRYKCLVESKGGMLPLHASKFIITSNFHPEACFTDGLGVVHTQLPALMRRINCVEFC